MRLNKKKIWCCLNLCHFVSNIFENTKCIQNTFIQVTLKASRLALFRLTEDRNKEINAGIAFSLLSKALHTYKIFKKSISEDLSPKRIFG
jgi:hypothetical protein